MTFVDRVINPASTPAWGALQALSTSLGLQSIRDLGRVDRDFLRLDSSGWHLDASRQRVTHEVFDHLLALAEQTGVLAHRDAMRAGAHINTTEGRGALHMALRADPGSDWRVGDVEVLDLVQTELNRMSDISERIRDGRWVGATGKRISHVINIGIGGSDLGPAMVYQALTAFRDPGITCLFVSNVDPVDIHDALITCSPETTLVIVSSKTFTTRETLSNAHVARDWLARALGASAVRTHFLAVSTNIAAAKEFGIPPESVVGFWDWVGGRYSVDSAIGLSLMIALGPLHFQDFLRGFRDMDEHFLSAEAARNLPIMMALCGIWNRDFLDIETVAVLPYSQRLARFPAYLQQLTMESNGKSVRRDGSPVDYPTSPIYWGEPGTNGQHSFYQLLHQGSSTVACDIIVIAETEASEPKMQSILVANALAQASVLSMGRPQDDTHDGPPDLDAHRAMPGNRPITMLMTRALTPHSLGALISLYEHMVFVQGAVWGINSFDQWGVEYGKVVAQGIESDIDAGIWEDSQLDEPTRHSLQLYFELHQQD
jgi:glucose-6-phosphate isomerase